MLQIFFDDSARNIAAGKAAGFHTVVVSCFTVSAFLEDISQCGQYTVNNLYSFSICKLKIKIGCIMALLVLYELVGYYKG